MKPRLIASDYSEASSVLAEVRAYGTLLESGLMVQPEPTVNGKSVRPDFAVGGDNSVIVEVHARQLESSEKTRFIKEDAKSQKRHCEFLALTNSTDWLSIRVTEHEVAPFGANWLDEDSGPCKPGDSVLTNAVAKIVGTKGGEKQADPAKPFVLWLDFQDPTVFPFGLDDVQFTPIWAHRGSVESGAVWMALYGRKGDQLVEMTGSSQHHIRTLQHEGRFYQTKRLSAIVFSTIESVVLMEHPDPDIPVPSSFRAAMLRTPKFRLDLSICEWQPSLVKQRTLIEREALNGVINAIYSNEQCTSDASGGGIAYNHC